MESIAKYGQAIPAQIEKETGMYKSHVSRALKELQEIKVTKCTNPDDRNYKFYILTIEGKKLFYFCKKRREKALEFRVILHLTNYKPR